MQPASPASEEAFKRREVEVQYNAPPEDSVKPQTPVVYAPSPRWLIDARRRMIAKGLLRVKKT